MDRNEGIIRWSPNPSRDEFLTINFNHRVVQLYAATGHAQPDKFDYQKLSKHNEFIHLNTYDWSPVHRGLVAIGTSYGEVQLLRVDDESNACITLPLKLQRSCQTVAFNTTGLLAVGLDRVRNDSCLQIWDVSQRLVGWNPKETGWGATSATTTVEPKRKLEASLSITSVRFFEDQPQTLVTGIKNQSVRIHDLRDPNSSVLNFQTRCNNNLAIDYCDSNYFASSSLDQPGFVIWDRRASSRPAASSIYLESFDQDEIPWGAVLKVDRAIQGEKNISVKQLRFSRERRGALGVLSTAGQLQVFQTKKEYIDPGSQNYPEGSPELLEVSKSYDLEYPYFDQDHKKRFEDRIVSFDWLNIGTADLESRVVALRANGTFEVLQMPAETASQLSHFIPWKPHRPEDPYMKLMKFASPNEQKAVLGPLFSTAAKIDVPVFGSHRYTTEETTAALQTKITELLQSTQDPLVNLLGPALLKMSESSTNNIAGHPQALDKDFSKLNLNSKPKDSDSVTKGTVVPPKVFSSRELHDKNHYSAMRNTVSSQTQGEALDHVMLQRAIKGYLFDCELNKTVTSEDPWLQNAWEWIAGAEEATADDGMVSGPLDLSYMGVYTVWSNLLGQKAQSRLIGTSAIPDSSQWDRLIASINKRAGRSNFQGVKTAKPNHRQLCLAICGLVKSQTELDDDLARLEKDGKHTVAAAYALFEGFPKRAVEILRTGAKDLLFVAMALDIKLKSKSLPDLDTSEWKKALHFHPQISDDPFLRAIYSFITTGDWLAIADETSLPLRTRVGVALRNFDDDKLTEWLSKQMEEATVNGDIEGIVLAGITDNLADIFAKYIEKFMDFQSPILILSFCYPRYITDDRCRAWRDAYKDLLQRNKKYILRVMFEQRSTIKSRDRDGVPAIKAPPRQITIRCLNCDAVTANDPANFGPGQSLSGPASTTTDSRNPLIASGINAGLCCPKCGAHLGRCAVCMEIVGVPRSDRPEQSSDAQVRRMANFPTFCLKCKHVMHMDHSIAWFGRHVECPVPECRCQCNERPRQA